MCARYELGSEELEFLRILHGLEPSDEVFRAFRCGEIRPCDLAPILRADGLRLARWGFPAPDKRTIINARAESLPERISFRRALAQGRAILPASAFFEWLGEKAGQKRKFRFTLESGHMALAALVYESATESGDETRFVIVTRPANESMHAIHDRMPVMLGEEEQERWLAPATAPESAQAIALVASPRLRVEEMPQPGRQTTLF